MKITAEQIKELLKNSGDSIVKSVYKRLAEHHDAKNTLDMAYELTDMAYDSYWGNDCGFTFLNCSDNRDELAMYTEYGTEIWRISSVQSISLKTEVAKDIINKIKEVYGTAEGLSIASRLD